MFKNIQMPSMNAIIDSLNIKKCLINKGIEGY